MTTKVFQYLWLSYIGIYMWFWGVLFVLAIGGWTLQASDWADWLLQEMNETGNWTYGIWAHLEQSPKVFLFVTGILFSVMVMPSLLIYGISRRTCFHAALRKCITVSALFVIIVLSAHMLEWGVARWLNQVYTFRFSTQEVWVHPAYNGVKMYFDMILSFVSGWFIGLAFYHKGWIRGIGLTIFGIAPVIVIGIIAQSEHAYATYGTVLVSIGLLGIYALSLGLLLVWTRRFISRVAIR